MEEGVEGREAAEGRAPDDRGGGAGAGALLLRRFSRWVKSRSGIKVALFELEPNVDPRIERLLVRLGFERKSNNLAYVRAPG